MVIVILSQDCHEFHFDSKVHSKFTMIGAGAGTEPIKYGSMLTLLLKLVSVLLPCHKIYQILKFFWLSGQTI